MIKKAIFFRSFIHSIINYRLKERIFPNGIFGFNDIFTQKKKKNANCSVKLSIEGESSELEVIL